jgi:hypothetical protein
MPVDLMIMINLKSIYLGIKCCFLNGLGQVIVWFGVVVSN